MMQDSVVGTALVDLLPVAFYVCGRDGALRDYNRRAAELWGREPRAGEQFEAARAACGSRLFDGAGQALDHQALRLAVIGSGQALRDLQAELVREDGTRRHVRLNISPLVDGAGVVSGTLHCVQEMAREAAAAPDAQGASSPAARPHAADAQPPHVDAQPLGDVAGSKRAAEPKPGAGEQRNVDAPPSRRAEGQPDAAAERERRATEPYPPQQGSDASGSDEALRLAFDQAPAGILLVDADLRVRACNAEAARLLGLDSAAVIGRELGGLAGELARACAQVLASGAETRSVGWITTGGRETHVAWRLRPTGRAGGAARGVLCSAVDGTQEAHERRVLQEAEEHARADGQLYRTMAEGMPQIVWTARQDGRADYYNRYWYDYTGFDREQTEATGWQAVVHPDDASHCLERWSRALRNGETFQVEHRLRRHDGVYRWFLDRAWPSRDQDGNILRWIGTSTDIDDQKRVEEALRETEQRFRLMADTAPVLIWIAGVDKGRTWFNKVWLDFTGQPLRQQIGEGWASGIHPDEREQCLEQMHAACERRTPFTLEYRLRRQDGTWRWMVDNGTPRFTHDGHFAGYIGSSLDITTRKEVEAALAEGEERTRAIIEASLDAVVSMDIEGRIIEWNGQAERVFGWTRAEALGRALAETIIPPQFRAAHYRGLAYLVRSGEGPLLGRRIEVSAVDRAGREFPVELSISMTRHGGRVQFSGFLRDITARREAERNLTRKAEELARSNAELEQFAYIASHDLQEPLRMVSSYLHLLQARYAGKLDAKAAQFIGVAVDGAGRMHQLIADLLSYSRAGKSAQAPSQPICCSQVVDEVSGNMSFKLVENEAAVEHGPLPELVVDRLHLLQLFQNLIGNALKYRSQAPPRIRISAERGEGHWVFHVDDNGIGIEPVHAQRVFEVFQRLHTREQYPGTGIGLAICKKIVERYAGRIWVEPRPGGGSRFSFTIVDQVALPPEGGAGPGPGPGPVQLPPA